MSLSNIFGQGFSKGVGGALLCVVLVVCGSACKRVAEEPDPALIKRAVVWGEMRADEIVFYAQEMTMLHPSSQRSQAARRTLIELDGVLRGEAAGVDSEVEDEAEEIE